MANLTYQVMHVVIKMKQRLYVEFLHGPKKMCGQAFSVYFSYKLAVTYTGNNYSTCASNKSYMNALDFAF
jgi:hypothetical protein